MIPSGGRKFASALKVVNNGGYGERLVNGNKSERLVEQEESLALLIKNSLRRADECPWTDRSDK
jgi:hypothetical protein